MIVKPLRKGDPRWPDLVAEIDEAINRGDEAMMERMGEVLHSLDPGAGAGSDI